MHSHTLVAVVNVHSVTGTCSESPMKISADITITYVHASAAAAIEMSLRPASERYLNGYKTANRRSTVINRCITPDDISL